MREVDALSVWSKLIAANASAKPAPFSFGSNTIDLARPCIVFGGRNGAGKTRVLKAIAKELGDEGAFLNLHHLIEQAHILYRSRKDLDEMAEEAGLDTPPQKRIDDLQQIIGRTYEVVEWSALDLGPAEDAVAEVFKWRNDQPAVPYFRVTHRGRTYASPDMGLGEFSVHFLLWILELYADRGEQKGRKKITLLLDEPDAFLPPRGVRNLLSCLQDLCLRRGLTLILSTHSEEMIGTSLDHEAFLMLRVDDTGETEILDGPETPALASELLARSPLEQVIFVEDEVAASMLEAAIARVDPGYKDRVEIVWGNGHGYMRELIKNLPKPPKPRVRFAFVFDGDQRNDPPEPGSGWPVTFLPTEKEPDELLRSVKAELPANAHLFGTNVTQMSVFLDSLEGENSHDWLIKLGNRYERRRALPTLSALWVQSHQEECASLLEAIRP
ncbi:hypothetical protein [Kocuria arenosa]|uniref:hypothetical protein n=1 Tax=Kocuria arenosa TaxID=3071446 RepID=UPI0034D42136